MGLRWRQSYSVAQQLHRRVIQIKRVQKSSKTSWPHHLPSGNQNDSSTILSSEPGALGEVALFNPA
jgi:hypothetical protein